MADPSGGALPDERARHDEAARGTSPRGETSRDDARKNARKARDDAREQEHDAVVVELPARAKPQRRRYSPEEKREAVERARRPEARVADVAAELGISASTLRRWLRDSPQSQPPSEEPGRELSTELGDWPDPRDFDWPVLPRLQPEAPAAPQPSPAEGATPVPPPAPAAKPGRPRPESPAPAEAPFRPGDDIFPALANLLPAYRFPVILAAMLAAVAVSTVVPADYPLRPVVQSLHVVSLVASFGAVLVIDWHGLLWLGGRRGLGESTRLAAAAGPLIWSGLAGLIATGALLHPNLGSPLTLTKLVLVLLVAWNGAAMSVLRRRLALLPENCTPADLPVRDWRLMMTATAVSQVGWWGAAIIGFINSSS